MVCKQYLLAKQEDLMGMRGIRVAVLSAYGDY